MIETGGKKKKQVEKRVHVHVKIYIYIYMENRKNIHAEQFSNRRWVLNSLEFA